MMLYVADLLYDGVSLALGSEEGPVAGRDGFVVLSYGHGHGAGEDVQGELLHPLVPVALVELCAVWTKKLVCTCIILCPFKGFRFWVSKYGRIRIRYSNLGRIRSERQCLKYSLFNEPIIK